MENQTVLKMTRGTVTLSDKERAEWAVRALRVYQKMEYTLTSLARAMTGRLDIRLELTPGQPRTDGQTIYYRPPLSLGDPSPHRQSQCERRDADGHLLCPACLVRESVLQQMYHEIAHIAFGTLELGGVLDRKKALKDGLIGIPEPGFGFIVKRSSTPEFQAADEYLMMAKLITPHLQFLLNCLEDARVDAAMFAEAPGTEKMFRSQTRRVFEGGFADFEGNAIEWRQNPTDAQIIIGCFCIAEGYDYTGWLHPQVESDLNDPALRNLLLEVAYAKKVSETFSISLKVINRLWEMGYCDPPSEEFPQGPGQSEEQEEEEEDGSADKEDDGGEFGESTSGTATGDEGAVGPDGTGSSDDPGDSQGDQGGKDEDPSGNGGPGAPGEATPGEGDAEEGSDEPGDGTDTAEHDRDSPDESAPEGSDQSPSETPDDTGSPGEGDESDAPGDTDQGNERSEASESEGVPESPGDGSGGDVSDDKSGEQDSDDDRDGDAGGAGAEEADTGGAEGSSGQGEDSTPEGTGEVGTDTDPADELQGDAGEGAEGSETGAGSDSGSEESTEPGVSSTDDPVGRPSAGEPEGLGDLDGEPSGDSESPDGPDEDVQGDTRDGGPDDSPGTGDGELPLPEPGSIEELSRILAEFTDHQHPEQDEDPNDFGGLGDEDPEHRILEEAIERNDKALDVAIIQGVFFENPSGTVTDVNVYTYKERQFAPAWTRDNGTTDMVRPIGMDWSPFKTDEAIMQPALAEMRRVFSENHRGGKLANQKSGKINARVLGSRAWSGDPRLFRRNTQPKRRSYMVLIGIDVSGSTMGSNIILSKKAAFAQAELCSRMGIDFEIWAHSAGITGTGATRKDYIFSLDMYQIKLKDEPWSEKIQERLTTIQSDSDNLDGHTIEFYRKRLMRSTATDKILLYYTDGHMPAANSIEEKRVLLAEIKNYKQQGIVMLGVGINTESPKKYGMDTVRVSDPKDIKKVVKHLERHLLETNR